MGKLFFCSWELMSIQPHLPIQNVIALLYVTMYTIPIYFKKSVEYMRLNPYFYLNQAMQEFGIKKN